MKTEETVVARKRRQARIFSAKEKCRAVLSLWSGRRNASAICVELGTNWGSVRGWELKGLEGIMEALEPNWRKEPQEGVRLGSRLEKLLGEAVKEAAPETAAVETK